MPSLFRGSFSLWAHLIETGTCSRAVLKVYNERIYRERATSHNLQLRFIDLLRATKTAHCTDPRDKIFAPLGLAGDVPDGAICIDYTRSLQQVSLDFMRFVISSPTTPYLEILAFVDTPALDATKSSYRTQCTPPLPTWVPDMRKDAEPAAIAGESIDRLPFYDPCPGTTVRAVVEGSELHIHGHVSGVTTVHLTTICESPEKLIETTMAWCDEIRNSGLVDVGQTGGIEESMDRTLVADKIYVRVTNDDELLNQPGVTLYRRGNKVDWSLIHSAVESLDSEHTMRQSEMLARIGNLCGGRRMGVASNGTVGIFPAATQVGDRIALFHGGGALYIIRAAAGQPGKFCFVGEGYVDGMMDGALMEQELQRGNAAGTIVLI